MKVIIVKDHAEMSKKAAEFIANQIKTKSNSVLGLATGSTPEQTYANLIKMNKNGEISFKDITTFNLDEYIGLQETHELSYRYFMNHQLFNHVDIDKSRTYVPSGLGNIKENAKSFENKMKELGPIDLQLLGLGQNAHIGFNEPGAPEHGRTDEVELTKSTIEANARFFNSADEVPKTAISMGIGTILDAKNILLLASGPAKAQAVRDMVEGNITTDVPASFLQKHNNTTIIIDEKAASLLKNK